jgi:S-adenosyl methyltransferase
MTQMSAGQVPGIFGIGSGLPLAGPVREVDKRAVPDDVVSAGYVGYAGYDPLVLTRARALLTGPPGTIDVGLNGPGTLLTAGRYPSGRRALTSCCVS